MDFQQQKTGKGNFTFITEDTIEKIACVKVFDDNSINNLIYNYHKKLLKIAKNKNNHMEVGFFLDLDDLEKEPLIIRGALDGFSISRSTEVNNLVTNSKHEKHIVVMHNHPRNGLFSSVDIKSFTAFKSISAMTAVCNDGTIYMMRKEANFDDILIKHYYNMGVLKSKQEYERMLLEKAKKLKLDINNPYDREQLANIPAKSCYYGIKNVAKHAKEIGITYRCSVKRK